MIKLLKRDDWLLCNIVRAMWTALLGGNVSVESQFYLGYKAGTIVPWGRSCSAVGGKVGVIPDLLFFSFPSQYLTSVGARTKVSLFDTGVLKTLRHGIRFSRFKPNLHRRMPGLPIGEEVSSDGQR
jgi:hypothetical protein